MPARVCVFPPMRDQLLAEEVPWESTVSTIARKPASFNNTLL